MSISKTELNDAIKKIDRPAAVAILARYGVLNTVVLPLEYWQAVFDACEEARKVATKS